MCDDVLCFTSPVHHFGLSWAAQDEDDTSKITVGVSKDGLYNIWITAKRKDPSALALPSEVEFIPEVKKSPEGFPPSV